MNTLKIAEVEQRPQDSNVKWFCVAPSALYLTALTDLRVAAQENRPFRGILLTYLRQAQRLPEEAWELAQKPASDFWLMEAPLQDHIENERKVELRAQVLELARLWFTEHLHVSIGHIPMGLHILDDQDWSLQPKPPKIRPTEEIMKIREKRFLRAIKHILPSFWH